MINVEAIVVGGGPAGSTCADYLKKGGVETIILDKKNFPRTKLCAGWITPKVIKDLQMDVDDYQGSLVEFDKLHFKFYGKKFPIRTHQYSIRRYEFDEWLLQRTGVPIHNHKVKEISKVGSNYVID
ncbi:MAG: NAD(P)-binding protein, partial [Planctomycetia bacterium]|nr:NAD(P)-binding protein [Planctomycetia bacterium]